MVLWEMTLGTAYFLGLKRTYRLALRLQRKVINLKQPKTRQFVQRRTRAVFDAAIKVHQKVQKRDREMGRNLGNYILRWLNQMKPSPKIRSPSVPPGSNLSASMTKHTTGIFNQKPSGYSHMFKRDSDRHFFSASSNILRKPFPSIAMMIRPWKPTGTLIQYRHLSTSAPEVLRSSYRANWSEGMLRKDIMQWMLQN